VGGSSLRGGLSCVGATNTRA